MRQIRILLLIVSIAAHLPAAAGGSDSTLQDLLRGERLQRGARTYARTCAACHGRRGQADGPAARDLSPPPRDFTQGQYRFRSTPTGELPRPEDLERTIRHGLPGSAMPAFGDLLSADEVRDVVRFLYSLLPENRIGDALPEPNRVTSGVPAGGTTAEGRGLYLLLECWSCHGLDGSGRGRASATLQDETGRRIDPPDFRYSPLKGGRDPEAIVRTLITGLNGTPMPAYDDALGFAYEDVADTAPFRERLPEPALRELADFVRTVPAKAEVDALDAAGKLELHDRRLRAIAEYVLSLDRRKGFRNWAFHEKPESEARR